MADVNSDNIEKPLDELKKCENLSSKSSTVPQAPARATL